MISNSFHNICFQKEPSGIKGKNSQPVSQIVISKPQKQLSNKLFNAAMFGLGLGVGDSIYSNYAQRRDIKRALNEYKNSPYSQKKLAILQLHNNGITVKGYKNNIKSFMELSIFPSVVKRGILYATIATLAGYVLHKLNKHSQKVS